MLYDTSVYVLENDNEHIENGPLEFSWIGDHVPRTDVFQRCEWFISIIHSLFVDKPSASRPVR